MLSCGDEWCCDRSMISAFLESRVQTSRLEHSVFFYQTLTSTDAPSGTSPCINPFESVLNFYLIFLDKGWVFWRSLGRKEAYKCQCLIAKLQAAQQGSGEMEQRKWHFVVETFNHSDSCHSGHYELIPGWQVTTSGPKEHLSHTSVAVSVFKNRPCQSWSWSKGYELTGKFASRSVNVTFVNLNLRTTI